MEREAKDWSEAEEFSGRGVVKKNMPAFPQGSDEAAANASEELVSADE
ncbi:MAG: hypothetical protein WBR26_14595 [Candidatus Acidiferrum sp.]